MTRLVFVRHGLAVDVIGRCIGRTDVALSRDGASAIRQLSVNALASVGAGRDGRVRVVGSDLARAFASAEIIAEAMGAAVERDARLREMNFGAWDGRAWIEIERNDADRFKRWMDNWTEIATAEGESVRDLLSRAADWLDDTLAPHNDGDCVIVVSHAGWIRAALTRLFAMDPSRLFEIPIDHARATVVDVTPSGNRLVASNVDRIE